MTSFQAADALPQIQLHRDLEGKAKREAQLVWKVPVFLTQKMPWKVIRITSEQNFNLFYKEDWRLFHLNSFVTQSKKWSSRDSTWFAKRPKESQMKVKLKPGQVSLPLMPPVHCHQVPHQIQQPETQQALLTFVRATHCSTCPTLATTLWGKDHIKRNVEQLHNLLNAMLLACQLGQYASWPSTISHLCLCSTIHKSRKHLSEAPTDSENRKKP